MRWWLILLGGALTIFGCKQQVKEAVTERVVVSQPPANQVEVSKGVEGKVFSSAVIPGEAVILGGNVSRVDSMLVPNIAKVNKHGEPFEIFNTNLGTGPNGDVMAIHILDDGKIIIAGEFDRFNGNKVGNIVCLKSDGRVDDECTAQFGTGTDGPIEQIKQVGDDIMISGQFSSYREANTPYVAFLYKETGRLSVRSLAAPPRAAKPSP